MSHALLRFDHVQLGMTEGGDGAAVGFYSGVLAMERVVPPAPLRGLWFRAGPVEVHLNVEEGFRPSRRMHPAIEVRGLDALRARCVAAGIMPRDDARYPGRRRFYVLDPFGNEIELFEAEPSSAG